MAQDEYFSFGDEDLGGDFQAAGLEDEGHLLGGQAVALAEPPEPPGIDFVEREGTAPAAERAARPRGDSKRASSERRRPSSRRAHLLAVAALAVLTLAVVRVTIAAIDTAGPAAPKQDAVTESEGAAQDPASADADALGATEQLRASRERAAEGQQVRQRRAKTRNRARRSRERRAAKRERRDERQQEEQKNQGTKGVSGQVPTEYVPPAPEVAPETTHEPAPESSAPPSGEAGLQDGSSSPEFGL